MNKLHNWVAKLAHPSVMKIIAAVIFLVDYPPIR
jgi:hypothetical protein